MTIKTVIRTTCLTLVAAALVACNTVQGLGEDIKSVGRTGEEVIND